MEWYIVIFFMLVGVGIFEIYGNTYRIGKYTFSSSLVISCFILLFFAAVRGVSVGADTRQYQIIFELCANEPWSNLLTSDAHKYWFSLEPIEAGYKIYNKLMSYISLNPQFVTAANSICLMIPLYKLINTYSPDKWLSIFLYFTLGFYQTALNLTPSAIASLIALNGIKHIEEKNFIKYCVCILIATCFHYSAFIFLPLYFIRYLKMTKKRFYWILIIGFVFIEVFFVAIIPSILNWIPIAYRPYLSVDISYEQILVYIVQLGLIIFCNFKENKFEDYWRDNGIYLWLFLIESIAYFASIPCRGLGRVAFLFSPITIITVPKLLYLGRKKRVLSNKLVLDIRVLVVIISVAIQYFIRTAVNNIGKTIPFVFFWNE